MRRLLPSRVELAIFAGLAVVLAGIATQFQPGRHDIGTAALIAPMFVFAAIMGLRRSPQWTNRVEAEVDSGEDA